MNEKLVYGENTAEAATAWTEREIEFYRFARIVLGHVHDYTVPQYGDKPNDEVEGWTPEQCVLAIQKYTKRFGSNQRGRLEILRDLAKIAHFAAIAFWKLSPTASEIINVKGGKV